MVENKAELGQVAAGEAAEAEEKSKEKKTTGEAKGKGKETG